MRDSVGEEGTTGGLGLGARRGSGEEAVRSTRESELEEEGSIV